MIYTVTLNPSLDYVVTLPRMQPGKLNRTESERCYPGGKGINVSIVLNNLGIPNRALGFVAGFTGEEICRLLNEQGCQSNFIPLKDGFSRINVKIRAREESEINGRGPNISMDDVEKLLCALDALGEGDTLILSGSVPNTLPRDIYEQILKRMASRNIRTVVDAAGELLLCTLCYRPFLIKPNVHELGELFGVALFSEEEIVACAKRLQEKGACNVLVSRAGDGAVLVCEDGNVLKSEAPKGRVVNSVGAGDSMVAGFLAGYLAGNSYRQAFLWGIAAGSATAFQAWLAGERDIMQIYQSLA